MAPDIQALEFRPNDRIAADPEGPFGVELGPPLCGHAVAGQHFLDPTRGVTPVANERSADLDVRVKADAVDRGVWRICSVARR